MSSKDNLKEEKHTEIPDENWFRDHWHEIPGNESSSFYQGGAINNDEIPDSIESHNQSEDTETPKRTVADKLVDLTLNSGVDLYLDQLKEPHVTLPEKPMVGYPIKSTTFRRWLSGKYWAETNKGFSGETFLSVVASLEGKVFHEGEVRPLFNRIAKIDGEIIYDLGDDQKVAKITPEGWQVTDDCPIRFRRFNHQLPQIEPISGGHLKDILKFINLKRESDQLLFLTYLIAVFIPDIPRVIFVGIGEQGAAKSTAMRVIRSLIDPSVSELLSPPADVNELAQAANHHYLLYFDNLSNLRDEYSDVLCRLATGIGFTKRKLFTDSEDILFSQKVAVGISGITLVANRADLLDRCLILNFERILDNKRLDEEDFWQQFNKEKPRLFGALLDIISDVLRIIPTIKLSQKPRMADYAKYAGAGAVAIGSSINSFLAAFNENINRQNQAAIESSPTAQVILQFMDNKEEWSGSSSGLYDELKSLAENSNLQIGGAEGFPKSSHWLWKKIMVVHPNLLDSGISATREEIKAGSVIKLAKTVHHDKNVAITADSTTSENEVSNGNVAVVATDKVSQDKKEKEFVDAVEAALEEGRH